MAAVYKIPVALGKLWETLERAWRLDEDTGDTYHDSISGAALTTNGSVVTVSGKVYDQAPHFIAASNQSLSEADSAAISFGDESFWLAAWVYIDSTALGNQDFISKWAASTFDYILWHDFDHGQYFAFSVSADGTDFYNAIADNTTPTHPSSATWYYLVAGHDANYDMIYCSVNGIAPRTTTHALGVFDSTNTLHIGSRVGGAEPLGGRVGGPALIGRGIPPLSKEIQWLYNSGNGRTLADIHGYAGEDEWPTYFSTFDNADVKLYILQSRDGITFSNVKGEDVPAYEATTLESSVRDPQIMYRNGKWWVSHTNIVFAGVSTHFSIASATNIAGTWTHVTDVEVGTVGNGINVVWGPKWFVDTDDEVYMIVDCSTTGDTGNFQTYYLHALDETFTSWSAATAITITSEPNVIDMFWVKKPGDSNYYIWYKDEQVGHKTIEYASSSTLGGPYTRVKDGNWAGWGNGLEGCSLNLLPDGVTWRLYTDRFAAGVGMAYSESTDGWATWTSLRNLGAPFTTRNGRVIGQNGIW